MSLGALGVPGRDGRRLEAGAETGDCARERRVGVSARSSLSGSACRGSKDAPMRPMMNWPPAHEPRKAVTWMTTPTMRMMAPENIIFLRPRRSPNMRAKMAPPARRGGSQRMLETDEREREGTHRGSRSRRWRRRRPGGRTLQGRGSSATSRALDECSERGRTFVGALGDRVAGREDADELRRADDAAPASRSSASALILVARTERRGTYMTPWS